MLEISIQERLDDSSQRLRPALRFKSLFCLGHYRSICIYMLTLIYNLTYIFNQRYQSVDDECKYDLNFLNFSVNYLMKKKIKKK